MTFAQVEHAERCMQQQWHYLVMAEQAGETQEALERMYDLYILLAEAYNACLEEYQFQRQNRRASCHLPNPIVPHQDKPQDAQLAS